MALESTARNLYSSILFGDMTAVLIEIVDTARVAANSSPDTGVTAAGSGVYDITFPKAQRGWFLSAQVIALGSAVQVEVVAFDATAGTAQIDTGSDLGGGDKCHILILLSQN